MPSTKEYTAVLYFHGMGSQRRHEESSRLIDAIDTYLSNAFHDRGEALGIVRDITPKLEELRSGEGEMVDYIQTRHVTPSDAEFGSTDVRFYEAYWAPIMADTRSAKDVAIWALKQALRPIATARTPWRERQRLRRAALSELFDAPEKWPTGTKEGDFSKLLRAYTYYNSLSVKRKMISPDLAGFQEFLATGFAEIRNRPVSIKRLQALAEAWAGFHRRSEYRNGFLMLTILLALGLAAGGAIYGMFQLLLALGQLVPQLPLPDMVKTAATSWTTPSLLSAASLVSSILLTLGAGRFLSNSLGDVQAWSTLDETNPAHAKREKVLRSCTKLMAHVLNDPNCTRALVISHSLGTSVAHDSLLRLGWMNKANGNSAPIKGPVPLNKIRHFVTMGSPIDKIQYFFESRRSDSHRYMRVLDTVRGDIATEPFANNGKPHIHWVNYWDEADVISGALHSDTGPKRIEFGVDNVHVRNRLFPNPSKAHMDYIGNRTVIGGIFEMAYLGRFNYGDLRWQAGQKGLDYGSVALKPGDPLGSYRLWQCLALSLPWAALFSLIAGVAGYPMLGRALLYGSGALAAVVLVAWLNDRVRGNRLPL